MTPLRKYGLIGYPLSHSFSPSYFKEKFENEKIIDAEYKAYPLDKIEDVSQLVDSGLAGFNITIPYKQQILPFLDEISEEASAMHAVNTVKIIKGKLHGYNTDCYGFEKSLLEVAQDDLPERALVLGTGGASHAIQYVLQQLGVVVSVVSRSTNFIQYSQLDNTIMNDHLLIVNTTPVGMYPKNAECPNIPYGCIGEEHILYDLIYNPEKTLFLKQGEANGARCINGLRMLHLQAEKSWDIWNNK